MLLNVYIYIVSTSFIINKEMMEIGDGGIVKSHTLIKDMYMVSCRI